MNDKIFDGEQVKGLRGQELKEPSMSVVLNLGCVNEIQGICELEWG